MQTPRHVKLIDMEPGQYYHIGLTEGLIKSLRKYFHKDSCSSHIKIDISIDGLPLSKSSSSQFWPILSSIVAEFYTDPFIVGIYHGDAKPKCCKEYLKYFIQDCKKIFDDGIMEFGKKIDVKINAIICDTPEKSFIKGTVGHNAYFGCGNCIQEGDYIEHRVTFPERNAILRSDDTFKQKQHEEHHKFISPLEDLNIGMITQIPLDYMHLVLLGVMKKLLQFWVRGKKNVRFTPSVLKHISPLLVSMSSSLPNEFSRKPRALELVDRFKATELRQILLYTGPVIFYNNLSSNQYIHFLVLSVAIRILCSPEHYKNLIIYARCLLHYFVKHYSTLYGKQHISYNVHNLIHLCDYVNIFGPLDKFSAFKYENYMQKIKKKSKIIESPVKTICLSIH